MIRTFFFFNSFSYLRMKQDGLWKVSTILEDMATDEQRARGLDIADFLLMEDTPQMILQRMIDRNPVLQTLIDELGLELVDAEQI